MGPNPNIPTTHKALVYDKPGEISTKIVDLETPKPGPGEVLVKLSHSGVCHSDLSLLLNSWSFLPEPTKAGQVGGHEGVGTVAQIGPSCENVEINLGDRVGIKWIAFACGNCAPCMVGADGICQKGQVSGYSRPGTFQEFVLAPAHYVTPIPDGLSSDIAAPLLCGGVTAYSALRKSRAQPGNWVVVAGAGGGLGHLALQLGSQGMGFRMIGLDVGSKETLAKTCGAEVFIDIFRHSTADEGHGITNEVMRATGGHGASAVVVCSASYAAYAQALEYLKFNGTLVCVGVPGGDPTPIANAYPHSMVAKQLAIVGSNVGSRKEAIETLDMAKRGVVKTHFTKEKLGSVNSIFQEMKAGNVQGRVVVDLQDSS